jgi:uncharacterized membrane protein HdeD (DUF308 family)
MTTENFSMGNAIWGEVKLPPWWLVLIEGILLIIIGIFLLLNPYKSFVSIIWVLGIYWLIRGILDLVSLIWDRTFWGWKIFAGILGIIAGWIVIQHPLGSSVVISQVTVFMLAFIGIFMGISAIVRAFKGAGWGTGIMGGISILLGILLLANSAIATVTLPWVLGFLAIFGGIMTIIGSFQVRSLEKKIDELTSS